MGLNRDNRWGLGTIAAVSIIQVNKYNELQLAILITKNYYTAMERVKKKHGTPSDQSLTFWPKKPAPVAADGG